MDAGNGADARARRVWRLAWLLSGADRALARAAAARVLGLRRDLARLEPARLDRLCVLAARHAAARARRGGPGGPARVSGRGEPAGIGPTAAPRTAAAAAGSAASDSVSISSAAMPAEVAAAIVRDAAAALPRQSLEAWILTRIEQLDEVRVARAMDCSRTAAERHLRRADELVQPVLAGWTGGRPEAALDLLRAALDRLDPGPEVKAVRARVRRARRLRVALALLCIVAGALAVVAMLRGQV
jgi:DNA-directed RNA polymerase specialized sigma24 family protein